MKIKITEEITQLDVTQVVESEVTIADFAVQHNAIEKSLLDAKGDLVVASGADTPIRLPVGANDEVLMADSGESGGVKWASAGGGNVGLIYPIYESGLVISTGVKDHLPVPADLTLIEAVLYAHDPGGSMVLDFWKCSYNDYDGGATHPVNADSITSSSPLTLTTGTKVTDSTLSGWTTSFLTKEIFAVNVDSCSGITRATLMMIFERA